MTARSHTRSARKVRSRHRVAIAKRLRKLEKVRERSGKR